MMSHIYLNQVKLDALRVMDHPWHRTSELNEPIIFTCLIIAKDKLSCVELLKLAHDLVDH